LFFRIYGNDLIYILVGVWRNLPNKNILVGIRISLHKLPNGEHLEKEIKREITDKIKELKTEFTTQLSNKGFVFKEIYYTTGEIKEGTIKEIAELLKKLIKITYEVYISHKEKLDTLEQTNF